MKNLKKLSVFFVALLVMVTVCSCGNQSIVGSWEKSYDMTDIISPEEIDEQYAEFDAEFIVELVLEFREDGTFEMYAEEDSIEEAYATFMDELTTYSAELIYQEYDAQGIERSVADEAMLIEYGYATVTDYVRAQLQSQNSVEDLKDSMVTKGEYKVVEDRIYLADEGQDIDSANYELFEINGKKLTFVSDDRESTVLFPGFEYPIEFTKK